ncbi:hypothetical protein INR49_003324, partial [Caranx melampygus]
MKQEVSGFPLKHTAASCGWDFTRATAQCSGNRDDAQLWATSTIEEVIMSKLLHSSLAFSEGNYGNDSGLAVYVAKAIDPSLCWDDISWLKKHHTSTCEDAVQALDVLEDVVQAVQGRCDVYLDGGVRRGTTSEGLGSGGQGCVHWSTVLWGLPV